MEKDIERQIIYGRNAVIEALRSNKEIDTVFIQKDLKIDGVSALAKERGAVVKIVGAEKITALAGTQKHGGVCAELCAAEYAELSDILEVSKRTGKPPFIIIADEIADPHNLGAIIRTAEAAGADGVHLGQSDIPCKIAREILGADKIIGVSSHNAAEALQAQKDGADYLGVGAAFCTSTKTNTTPVSPDTIREIREAVSLPFVVIGGVNEKNISQLYGLGINGAAVVSAICAKPDITAAAREMRKAAEQL